MNSIQLIPVVEREFVFPLWFELNNLAIRIIFGVVQVREQVTAE